jgi:hypothetical protein
MKKNGYGGKGMSKGYGSNDRYRGAMSGRMAEVMGHASPVYSIDTMSEDADMGRMRYMKQGNRGYPAQAFQYEY